MEREIYLKHLASLREHAIEHPMLEDLQRVCPHLSEEQIGHLMILAETNPLQKLSLASPAVMIENSVHVLHLEDAGTVLRYGRHQQAGSPSPEKQIRHMQEALAYAKKHWADDMTVQSSMDVELARQMKRTRSMILLLTRNGHYQAMSEYRVSVQNQYKQLL